MKTLARVFKMPWIASLRNWHAGLFGFIVLILSVDVSKTITRNGGAQFGIAVVIAALVIVWKMVSNTLWLARDARALRLPGVERDADFALLLFALASIVAPALLLGALFGNPIAWLVSMALVAFGTLAFCILPTLLGLPLFAVAVIVLPFGWWKPPLPGNPEFLAWAVPVLIALVVASLQRWIAIRRAVTLDSTILLRPLFTGGRMVQMKRLRGEAYRAPDFGGMQSKRKPTCDTLNRVGPDYPVRSIRTALGAHLMPFDVRRDRTHDLRWQLGMAVLVLVPPFIAALAQRHFGATATLAYSPQLLLYMTIMTIMPMGEKPTLALWQQHHAGLSLLALLPRLDAPTRLKHDTLMACVERNLRTKLWFSVSAVLVLAILHLPAMFYGYLGLMLICGTLLDVAIHAHMLGGKVLPRWLHLALYFATIMVPMIATQEFGIRVILGAQPHLETFGWQALVCVALWLLWCVGFGLLALRGWRAIQRRPHPFLPNPSQ